MTVPKSVIRRFPPFANFQKFLVAENDVGNISRQEVVSMIPPLVMDIRPGMTVLDLCAAPGSKSAQLLEMVLAGEEERTKAVATATQAGEEVPQYPDDGRSTGLLIANDVDYKRAHMLVHQLKRLSSANLIVTNHDATMFPSIKLPSGSGAHGKQAQNKYLKFDRILADVPCSGDGTVRKNLEIWRTWTPQNGLGLHTVQTRILVRALQMLKVGGRVVYSTCSMNPIEDEAVLVAAIDRCGGPEKVKLVDCNDKLTGLQRYPGLRKWSVMDRNGDLWDTYADVEAGRKSKDDIATAKLSPSMFPPTELDLQELPLQHAMRVYPHSQDTGAFFIAVLEKVSEIRARSENETRKFINAVNEDEVDQIKPEAAEQDGEKITESFPLEPVKSAAAPEATSTADSEDGGVALTEPEQDSMKLDESPSLKRKNVVELEDSSKRQRVDIEEGSAPVPVPSNETEPLQEQGAVSLNGSTEKTESASHAISSTSAPERPLAMAKKKKDQPFEEPFKYLSSNIPELEQIRNFYTLSDKFPMDRFMVRNAEGKPARNIYYTTSLAKDILTENEGKGLKFVHSGVKMFVKQDVPHPDSCPWRIQTDGLTLIETWTGNERVVVCRKKETFRKLLVEMFPKFAGEAYKDLGEVGPQVLELKPGCCVLRIEPGQEEDDLKEYMVFPLWKSVQSLNLMLPKEDRRALLLRLFNDSTPLVNPMKGGSSGQSKAHENNDEPADQGVALEGNDTVDEVERKIERGEQNGEAAREARANTSSEDERA